MIALSQASYIDKVPERFSMKDSKKGAQPFKMGIKLSRDDCPKTSEEKERMKDVLMHLW